MKEIIINGNTFHDGDMITAICDYDLMIISGKIFIDDKNTQVFYLSHNHNYYHGSKPPVQDNFGYKHAYCFKINDKNEPLVIFHDLGESIQIIQNDYLSKDINNFTWNVGFDIYTLLFTKLGLNEDYDSLTSSEVQGFVEFHSSTRNKKLSIKMGRLIKRLSTKFAELVSINPLNIPYEIKDDAIEKIHNSWMATHESAIRYEIVSGADILKGYTRSNYIEGGATLQNSCMVDKYNYLSIYTDNPDKISLMIFYQGEKVCGRSLLWKADDGILYHDRIYYGIDWLEKPFLSILKKNGYEKLMSEEVKGVVSVKLDKLDFIAYPYLDCFYSVSFKTKTLYYDRYSSRKIKYELRSTGGLVCDRTHISEIDSE